MRRDLAHVPRLRCRVSSAQVLDVATRSPGTRGASRFIEEHLMTASTLVFVVVLLVTLFVLRRQLRGQLRRNELSMTYIPW
jgi:hypothetical protein